MNVLLTGGTGLVGSHALQKLIELGDSVDAVVRGDVGAEFVAGLGATPVHADLLDEDFWQSVSCDAIVHAAAVLPRRAEWEEFERVNVDGTRLIAEAAARTGARLVYVSTVAVYGSAGYAGDGSPIVEDTPFEPLDEFDFYGRSKRLAERALWDVVDGSASSAVALRPCVIYGPHDRLFSPKIVKLLRFGIWPLVGNGTNALAVVYAGNVADAIVAALDHPEASGAFNVTNDGEISQRDFFAALGRGAGHRVRFLRLPRPLALTLAAGVHSYKKLTSSGGYGGFAGVAGRWLSRENPYSSDKAVRELHWRPTTDPRDAARITGEALRE